MWRVGFVYKKDKNGGAKQNSETQDTHTHRQHNWQVDDPMRPDTNQTSYRAACLTESETRLKHSGGQKRVHTPCRQRENERERASFVAARAQNRCGSLLSLSLTSLSLIVLSLCLSPSCELLENPLNWSSCLFTFFRGCFGCPTAVSSFPVITLFLSWLSSKLFWLWPKRAT